MAVTAAERSSQLGARSYVALLLLLEGIRTFAHQADTTPKVMDQSEFITVVLGSLAFHSSVTLLIVAAYGFAIGRICHESKNFPKARRLLPLVPGLIAVCAAVYLTGSEYTKLAGAISGIRVTTYATEWAMQVQIIEACQAVSVLLLLPALFTSTS